MNDTPYTSPEAVERFDLQYGGQDVWIGECENGDYVLYDDYVALSAALEAERASNKIVLEEYVRIIAPSLEGDKQ